MTEQDKKRVNEELTKANGNRRQAAAVLGMSVQRLRNVICSSPLLRSQWVQTKNPGPTAGETMQGPPAVAEPTETQVQQSEREEGEFRKLLETTGKTPEDVVLAMSYQQMFGRHVVKVVNVMGGGAMARSLRLLERIEALEAEFDAGFTGEHALAEFEVKAKFYVELHNAYRGLFDAASQSMAAKAKIEMYRQQQQQKQHQMGGLAFPEKRVKESIPV